MGHFCDTVHDPVDLTNGCDLCLCFQCLDTVGWASRSASGLLKLSVEVLAWLSVWSKVQMIAHGPADATVTPSSLASLKFRLV